MAVFSKIRMSLNKYSYTYFFILFSIFCISPFLIAVLYIHPFSDDYIFCLLAKGNFLDGTLSVYKTWTGRFTSTFFQMLFSFDFPFLRAYRLVVFLYICLIPLSSYVFLNELVKKSIQPIYKISVVLVFFSLVLYRMPSIPDSLYWFNSAFTNFLPIPFLLIFLSLVIRNYYNASGFIVKMGLFVFSFLMPAFNEPMLVVVLFGSWSILLVKLYKRNLDLFWLVICLTITLSSCLSSFAPGNMMRSKSEFSVSYSQLPSLLLSSVINSVKYGILFMFSWLNGILLILTVMFLPLFQLIILKNRALFSKIYSIPLILGLFISVGIYFLTFLPSAIIIHSMPFLRTQNTIFGFLYIVWFYNVGFILHSQISNGKKMKNKFSMFTKVLLFLFIVLSLKNTISQQNNIGFIYTDLISSKASTFSRACDQRYKQLLQTRDTVCVYDSIPNLPRCVASGFLSHKYDDPQNSFMLSYYQRQYGVKAKKIIVKSR